MIYDTLSKGEDGLYHSRALNDEIKRYFVQLDGVIVSDVDQETGEVSFEVTGEDNQAKVESVHTINLQSALENSKMWFGKELPEKTISGAYTRSEILKLIVFPQHVFSITLRKVLNLVQSQSVCHVQHSWNFLDFGLRRKVWSILEYCPIKNSPRKNPRSRG